MGKNDDPVDAVLAIAATIAVGAGLLALLKLLNEPDDKERR